MIFTSVGSGTYIVVVSNGGIGGGTFTIDNPNPLPSGSYAPSSIADGFMTCTIVNGSGSLASSGVFTVAFTTLGNCGQMAVEVGILNPAFQYRTSYTYQKLSGNVGQVTVAGQVETYTFTTPTSGVYTFVNPDGSQATGTFVFGSLALTTDISISVEPANQVVQQGGSGRFSITASKNTETALSYQWECSVDAGETWIALTDGNGVSGADTQQLTISNVAISMNGYGYAVIVSDGSGTLISSVATLTVSGPPEASTGQAGDLTSSSATIAGTVVSSGSATSACFNWGTTKSYGNITPAQSLGSGTAPVGVSANLTGLIAGTTYHYQIVASNANSTTPVLGSDQTFTTPPSITARSTTLSQYINSRFVLFGQSNLGILSTEATDLGQLGDFFRSSAIKSGENLTSDIMFFGVDIAGSVSNLINPLPSTDPEPLLMQACEYLYPFAAQQSPNQAPNWFGDFPSLDSPTKSLIDTNLLNAFINDELSVAEVPSAVYANQQEILAELYNNGSLSTGTQTVLNKMQNDESDHRLRLTI